MTDPRAHQIDRARALQAEGATLREIATTLAVSSRTVSRWLNPGAAERSRERSRAAKQARRRPCQRCSRPLSYDRASGLCSSCQSDESSQRQEQVASLYQAGHQPPEIARRVSLAEGHVRNLISALVRSGALNARYARRDGETVRERERSILALRARSATHAQIAEAVNLTPGAVNQTLVRLRGRGEARAA